jgi:hypothetical protein
LVFLSAILAATSLPAAEEKTSPPAPATDPPSKFRSADDGWLDVSGFLDERYGFIPLVIPITEPAVGFEASLETADRRAAFFLTLFVECS